MRGIDESGNCSNFVETELLTFLKSNSQLKINSYTIVRGSIALIWSQTYSLFNFSKINLFDKNKSKSSLELHIKDLENRYRDYKIINLIDKTNKSYFEIAESWDNYFQNKVSKYSWFDQPILQDSKSQ